MTLEPTIAALLCFFLVVVILSSLNRTSFNYSGLSLFRVFFPSWRFFEDTCGRPALYARIEKGVWKSVLEKPQRSFFSLFFNPEGNLFLAYGSLLERLLKDASELQAGEEGQLLDSVSYRLVRNLVESKLSLSPGVQYQFKVCVSGEAATREFEQDALISSEHAV